MEHWCSRCHEYSASAEDSVCGACKEEMARVTSLQQPTEVPAWAKLKPIPEYVAEEEDWGILLAIIE